MSGDLGHPWTCPRRLDHPQEKSVPCPLPEQISSVNWVYQAAWIALGACMPLLQNRYLVLARLYIRTALLVYAQMLCTCHECMSIEWVYSAAGPSKVPDICASPELD